MVAHALVIEQGRWIRRLNEVFIGPKLSKEKKLALGDPLRLNGREFTVAGIGKLRGAGFTADAVAYIDRQSLRQRAETGDTVSFIMVDTARPADTRRMIHDRGSFAVQDTADIMREIDQVYATALALYWVLIVLTLAIAGLFVNNMLAHSVAERRMEFATLRAIGMPSHQILLTIAVEASLISVAAWVVGLLVSFVLGEGGINGYVAPQYGLESLYTADAQLFALIFALALGLGVVSGLLPARKATRIDPVIVLREG
jgi:ABC-type antimicrobial peptide transport system permease subunit